MIDGMHWAGLGYRVDAQLMGEADKQPDEEKGAELATALINTGTMLRLIQNLAALPFEARKETSFVSGTGEEGGGRRHLRNVWSVRHGFAYLDASARVRMSRVGP